MSLATLYRTDPELNENGRWFSYPKNKDGTTPRFRMSRMSLGTNKKYAKALEVATRQYRREIELETLDDDISDDISLSVFCDTILLEWEHFQPNDDGVDLPYSPENAKRTLSEPEWLEFYNDLRAQAAKAANFRNAQLERDAKN